MAPEFFISCTGRKVHVGEAPLSLFESEDGRQAQGDTWPVLSIERRLIKGPRDGAANGDSATSREKAVAAARLTHLLTAERQIVMQGEDELRFVSANKREVRCTR